MHVSSQYTISRKGPQPLNTLKLLCKKIQTMLCAFPSYLAGLLIIVFGLISTVSGLANELDAQSDQGIPDWDVYEAQRNAAIAIYQSVAEKVSDNIALSLSDILTGLTTLYDEISSPPDLNSFLNFFRVNCTAATQSYVEILRPFNMEKNKDITFGSNIMLRGSCELSNSTSTITSCDKYRDKEYFSEIKYAATSLVYWYQRRGVNINFLTKEFEGQECSILHGGGYFRHKWQESDRCVMESNFFHQETMFEPLVKYTRVTGDFPGYGELPELSAKYIEVPWTADDVNIGLYVILPDAIEGLEELNENITGDTIKKMVNESNKSRVDVTLPDITFTRKYHLLPIITNVSTAENPDQLTDLINVVTIDAFEASGKDCSLDEESTENAQFHADHAFLMVIVYKGDGTGRDAFILGIAAHREPERMRYLMNLASYD